MRRRWIREINQFNYFNRTGWQWHRFCRRMMRQWFSRVRKCTAGQRGIGTAAADRRSRIRRCCGIRPFRGTHARVCNRKKIIFPSELCSSFRADKLKWIFHKVYTFVCQILIKPHIHMSIAVFYKKRIFFISRYLIWVNFVYNLSDLQTVHRYLKCAADRTSR